MNTLIINNYLNQIKKEENKWVNKKKTQKKSKIKGLLIYDSHNIKKFYWQTYVLYNLISIELIEYIKILYKDVWFALLGFLTIRELLNVLPVNKTIHKHVISYKNKNKYLDFRMAVERAHTNLYIKDDFFPCNEATILRRLLAALYLRPTLVSAYGIL